ncbi:MAG: hypothetical protein ABEJ30_02150 [Halorientalis sp.]
MTTRRAVACAVLVVTVLSASGVAGPGPAAAEPVGGRTVEAATTQVDADTVLLRAAVAEDGDARWQIEYLVRLDDRNATDAFESLAADIAANRSAYERRFARRIGATVASAENRTGRAMALRNVSVTTARQDLGADYGVIRYTFTWTGFAATDGSDIVVGDALGGFFLDADTQLTVTWPRGYGVASVTPAPTDRREHAVVWEGRLDFGSEGPRLVLTPVGGLPVALLAVAVVLVALLAGGAVAYRRGWLGRDSSARDGAEATGGDPPADLLSNEERVLKILEEEGGRVKQQAVAERLDWTDAKTSQVVGDLREDGKVEVFRLGRENVLTLPEEGEL